MSKVSNPGEISRGKIEANLITASHIEVFDPKKLSPAAKAQWELFGRRIEAMEKFDSLHPKLFKLQSFPILRQIYHHMFLKYLESQKLL